MLVREYRSIYLDLECLILRYLFDKARSNLFNLTMRDDRLKEQDESIIARGNSSRDPSFLLFPL
ncbi:hypothetical protein N7453_002202 [Penicillium expansum]|nr:hypothetical protein N7453_002202 [Penicillium expansum]